MRHASLLGMSSLVVYNRFGSPTSNESMITSIRIISLLWGDVYKMRALYGPGWGLPE